MNTLTSDRTVPLEGASNFRDLGGYPTVDGRRVLRGRVYRADGLGMLTPTDLDVIDAVGIRTVIDLRTSREIDERGRFPVDVESVQWHHLSVVDQTWDHAGEMAADRPVENVLADAYADMLAEGAPRFAVAFRLLAETGALPAVFHCAAGKDRTGLLAALLLGSLGVDHDEIAADFALTDLAMPAFIERMKTAYPERSARMSTVPPAFLSAPAGAMHLTLAHITDLSGSVRAYVRDIGVPDEVVDELAHRLVGSASLI
jgi:protein-tyrosine phosphatase